MEQHEIYCRVYGRVQLVMFRDFVKRRARRLGLVGSVRNREDGSVEVAAQGPAEKLKALVEYLHRGSLFSRVDRVEVEWRAPAQAFDSFVILF